MANPGRTVALLLVSLLVSVAAAWSAPPRGQPTDEQLRQMLIERSISEYPGNCPCPYNVDRAGRACGRRSAWSRAGGRAPYCYPKDVPQEQVDRLRAELAA